MNNTTHSMVMNDDGSTASLSFQALQLQQPSNVPECVVVAHQFSSTSLISSPTPPHHSSPPSCFCYCFTWCQFLESASVSPFVKYTLSFFSSINTTILVTLLYCVFTITIHNLLFLFLSQPQLFQFPLQGFCFVALPMGSWRKQHGEGHHHWTISSSYHRKPPLGIWRPAVPRWERMFCASVGSIPWRKLVENKKYINLHEKVMNWDDSAGKEAFDNAKKRFWETMNDLPCDISLPDPDMHIDDIDWNSTVDPELALDLEREVAVTRDEKVVIFGDPFILNQSESSGFGWGDDEADTPKNAELAPGAQVSLHGNNSMNLGGPLLWNQLEFSGIGWGVDEANTPKNTELVPGAQVILQENNSVSPWQQNYAGKEYEWNNGSNDTWGWNQREHYHSYTHQVGGGAGWNQRTWYGDNRKEENKPWYKASAYHYSNDYQTNRGRRNDGERKRGDFA